MRFCTTTGSLRRAVVRLSVVALDCNRDSASKSSFSMISGGVAGGVMGGVKVNVNGLTGVDPL